MYFTVPHYSESILNEANYHAYDHHIENALISSIFFRNMTANKKDIFTLVRTEQPINKDYHKREIDALPAIQMFANVFFQSIKQANFAKIKQLVSMKFICCFLVISPH